MENDKKSYTIDEIMEEARLNDPQQYEEVQKHLEIEKKLFEEYKKTANIPEFNTPEEYHAWQQTSAGKKHMKTIEKIDKQAEEEFKRQHGGSREGAGRKKLDIKKIKTTFELLEEDRKALKEIALSMGKSQNEIITRLIQGLRDKNISI